MRIIDIHAHLTPQCFWRATESGGDWHSLRREQDGRGRQYAIVGGRKQELPPKARWNPEERLADMDTQGVDVHVVSPYTGFYNYGLDTAVGLATSKDTNNEIHEMIQARPDRFTGLANLPMQDVPAAVAELERVMLQLGFKGAMINDHVNGQTLDSPTFLPFWKAAEQLGALIMFHQAGGTIVTRRITRYHLANGIGTLADRALTFASLVFGGVMDACPDLKICLAHGGGYTCFGIGRMDYGWQTRPEAHQQLPHPPSSYLRRFYYDCIVLTEPAMRYLIDAVGVDRVVFGTDWPYDMGHDWPVSWILSLESLTQYEKEAILWKNLERLLGV